MKCPFSIPLKDKYDIMGNPIMRACGQCAICRRNAMMTLVSRGNYEYKKHKYNAFLTLTYDDNHLFYRDKPFGEKMFVGLPSVNTNHVQKFCDALRHYVRRHKLVNCDKDFSFLYCTEYGGVTARPHAHILLFGLDFPIAKKIAHKLWKFGFVDCKPVTDGAIRYVCKYISKGAKGKYADLQYTDKGVNKPVVKWSKGFGKGLYYDNYDKIQKDGYIKVGNKKILVPSYYKYKIVNTNIPNLFKQEIDKQFTYIQKHNLAKHFGFNSVEEFERKMALNSIHNELNKNILNKVSVDLSELGSVK